MARRTKLQGEILRLMRQGHVLRRTVNGWVIGGKKVGTRTVTPLESDGLIRWDAALGYDLTPAGEREAG